ncbi:5'-nucleotidase C-terminal domain-containing protein [Marinobacter zhejiangensis]|uniref:5'-nucleotidase n=1 Tax=Marinobacter zhejiangensis TaxID=488535 RepID=A0A1I4PYY9_9GAMM|nr:5'-nucleotidase C-terminal domain-containing protein [Marinobacter zhejiangensis]SFM32660.1 5'-nucleotidase [Marinobacter zhejiangensis]
MNHFKHLTVIGCIGLGTLLTACSDDNDSASSEQSSQPLALTILHTNDHHSYFEGQSYDLNLDYDPGQTDETVRVNLGGFPRIANAINDYRDDNTLVLNSGELNGTLYFSLFKGEVDFKVFNMIGLDAYELGNHEFDEGDAHLADLLTQVDFPVLAGNVKPTPQSPLYGSNIQPYIIKEIDNQLVGIIGVLKVEKTRESSMVSDDVLFDDEIESVRGYISELQGKSVNKIIVLSHLGYDFDQVLAANVSDIDVIVGGDTHDLLDSTGELASMGITVDGGYPTVIQSPSQEPVYLVQAWEYAKGLGRLNVNFDEHGKVSSINGNLELLVGNEFQVKDDAGLWVPATTEQQTRIEAGIDELTTVRLMDESQEILDLIAPYKAELEAYKLQSLGTVTEAMPFTRIPTDFAAGEAPTGSYAAQVVADAFLTYLPKADVAIQNAGGVRAPLEDGDFTVADAYTILPFSNTVITIDMTGEQIVKVLNEALDYAQGISASTGAFPYSANLRYDVTLGTATGTGIQNVDVRDPATGTWGPIDLQGTYTVATNSFTGLGKDGYVTFGEVREANPDAFEESDVAYVVPLIEYFRDELPDSILPALDPNEYCLKSVTTATP